MKKILIAEDEATIREFVVINLVRSGYQVFEASTGTEAVSIFEEQNGQIDIAILDIMMPGMDGFEVCRTIRAKSATIGIIMLTARTQEMDKVGGLMLGADDYITKPFSPSELVARVDALYRRVSVTAEKPGPALQDEIRSGDFVLNLRGRTLSHKGKMIELTHVEFQIMEYFISNPGKPLDRTDILNRVWGEAYFGEEKIVDVNVRRLRMKIEEEPSHPKHILTVWGLGYKWNAE